jgi:hypothetical protein
MDIKWAEALHVATGLAGLFAGSPDAQEPWATDEQEFEDHFDTPYWVFCEKLTKLSADQQVRYKKTLEVNPEAAVLWVVLLRL